MGPGILLSRRVDRRSPTRRFDTEVLLREIDDLERAVHPMKLVKAVRHDGPFTEVTVLAASATRSARPPGPAQAAYNRVAAWRDDGW